MVSYGACAIVVVSGLLGAWLGQYCAVLYYFLNDTALAKARWSVCFGGLASCVAAIIVTHRTRANIDRRTVTYMVSAVCMGAWSGLLVPIPGIFR